MSHPTEPVRSRTSWFVNLRKAALFASIAGALSILIPIWNGLHALAAIGAARPVEFTLVAVSLLATATMPVFTFALYQDPGTLHFPKHLRSLALAAAIILTLMVTWGLPQWIGSLLVYLSAMQRAGAAAPALNPMTIYHVSTLLAEISNLALILLLISFFRQEEKDPADTDVAISSTLRIVTRATVIVWGIWLGFNLIRGILTPYTYLQLRNYAAQTHRAPPQAIDLVAGMLSAILTAACWFSVPYIVYKSQSQTASPKEDERM